MATYAIGDIQGCFADLQRLLDKCNFDPASDTLWFAGDLVNRGPDSLATLRFVKQLGKRAISVLGNHDLHLLAIAADHKNTRDRGLIEVMQASDADELVHWLRHRPLLHHDELLGFSLVHAGIYPLWSLKKARKRARELEAVLRSDDYLDFIHHMYGNTPNKWDKKLEGWDRLRFICNSFTRMRYCYPDGRLEFADKGPRGTQQEDTMAWFDLPGRKKPDSRILFGHWSTLGLLLDRKDVYSLDTGCLWGGRLTALRLDGAKPEYISVSCTAQRKPPAL